MSNIEKQERERFEYDNDDNYENSNDTTNGNNKNHFYIEEKQDLKYFIFGVAAYAFCFYVLSSFIQVFLIIIYNSINNLPLWPIEEITKEAELFITAWTNFLTYIIGAAAIIPLLIKPIKRDLKSFSKKPGYFIKWIFISYGILLGFNFVANTLIMILQSIFKIDGTAANNDTIIDLINSRYAIWTIIAVVILAPIIEELIFRKSLFGILGQFVKKAWARILITGSLFGAIHVVSSMIGYLLAGNFSGIANEMIQSIAYISMGCAIGLVYEITKHNVITVISMHAINNLVSTIIIIIEPIIMDYLERLQDMYNVEMVIVLISRILKI